jgi:hypothetical protein
MTPGLRFEAREINHCEIRREAGELVRGRTDHQMTDEQRMPGILANYPDLQPVDRIRTGKQVLYMKSLPSGVRQHVGLERFEMAAADRPVMVPPHRGPGRFRFEDEPIIGGAAGVPTGGDDQRTARG